ncbi:MAG: rhomboid family intramembrane serine protease [Desulfobacteraceae bacterium]|jgi:membrane associated rhomboid family serine protease|nr:rhomboid family intramembrane serine protease [Desulfobacteraceae bacterium]
MTDQWITIAASLSRERAETFSLVLSASGLPHDVQRSDRGWSLRVDPAVQDLARETIDRYIAENSEELAHDEGYVAPRKWNGSAAWAVLALIAFHVAARRSGDFSRVVAEHGASSSAILQGEVQRALTALLLHADELHLAGNLMGIAVFGTAVSSIFGAGLGWLMILISGIAGNLANAWFFQSGHTSIGASTAVFGAVGILAAWQFARKKQSNMQRRRAWLPLAAGLALLALLGSGAHTDIMAHGFGFAAGLVLGYAGARGLQAPRTRENLQIGCVLVIVALMVGAWW